MNRPPMLVRRLLLSSAIVFVSLPLFSLSCADGTKCNELRTKTAERLKFWSGCEDDTDCIKVGGSQSDCTGVLTCPFAVNKDSRNEAEQYVLKNASESVVCHVCEQPDCIVGDKVVCEKVSKQCIIVTEAKVDSQKCVDLRNATFDKLRGWQGCATDDDCIQVAGSKNDCTGVLACNFAVNKTARVEAEQAVLATASASVVCGVCPQPTCADGKVLACEPQSGLCIIRTDAAAGATQ